VSQRLKELVAGIADFDKWQHADKLRFFAWVLHDAGNEQLKAPDFAACYDALHLHQPVNLRRSVEALEQQGDLLKSGGAYRLSKPVRDRLEAKYGKRAINVQVHELLASLPGKLTAAAQQSYLDEALRCFRAEAWRAAAIMAWNLAFDHLCGFVVTRKLAEFNGAYPTIGKKKPATIAQRSDLQELKESEVILVCRTARITDGTQHKCLERNLGIRNDIAHPSAVSFEQPNSEAFILEVVQTIVLGLR
jgi:hypothetical protein